MTVTDKERAARLRSIANQLRDLPGSGPDMAAAELEYEADRLDPPAPTGKTVTWTGKTFRRTFHLDENGVVEHSHDGSTVLVTRRAYIDNVVLPLLADAPDGPIPDETVRRAWDTYLDGGTGMDYMRVALEAVRGLPGMAVVRAGTPPKALAWAALPVGDSTRVRSGAFARRWATRQEAEDYARRMNDSGPVEPYRVVAIIADPGEGTV